MGFSNWFHWFQLFPTDFDLVIKVFSFEIINLIFFTVNAFLFSSIADWMDWDMHLWKKKNI